MTFHWTATTLLISLLVLLLAAGCCLISWRRSGYTRSMGILEALRFLLVFMAVVSLNQPELLQEYQPDEQPTLVVMYDVSESMQTQDVIDPERPAGTPLRRMDRIEEFIPSATSESDPATENSEVADVNLPELWSGMSDQLEVVFEPFSSTLSDASRGTDFNQALKSTYELHSNLRGIVLISDGDWNTGTTPAEAATELRMRNVPVFAVAVGSEDRLPDVQLVNIDAPTFGIAGKTMRIPFRINNWLPKAQELSVTLSGTLEAPISKTVRVQGMGELRDTINWRPTKTGDYKLRLEIPVADEESNPENNVLEFPIRIQNETLKVLIVESYPRWEYRYLRNALERDPGVDVHCLLFHPDLDGVGGGRGYLEQFPGEEELFDYDVVFLGDVGVEASQLTIEETEQIRQLVRNHAGGLVFLPGFRGKQETLLSTELEELYPVIVDPAAPRGHGLPVPARFSLTESGRRSQLTRLEVDERENERVWSNLPGFQWYASALRSKIGGEVLAVHETESTRFGRVPLIVARTFGTGKVLFMGTDGAWRWRKGVEDLYHYRFWGQVVRWMAYQRNMSQGESMRLFYSPDRPEAGNVLTLNANVSGPTGEPLQTGTVVCQITSPSGQVETLRLQTTDEESWGLFTGMFTPEEGGNYTVLTTCTETGTQLETTIAVAGGEREVIGDPARFDVLHEIATISRGEVTDPSQMNQLVDKLAKLEEPEPVVRRLRVWAHPLWGGLMILLLAVFWSGRKLAGLA
ncbi:hypothetical protein KOR42_12470 [Thalassoglobus neptunius]|uniref:VWFA domain-containing protein n=1 Tax=Thalassoglobus neptunius TaxID=1938619 RepID=A0A5C5X4Q8_9PLAN|nr:hypothetical protein [Thalassoglobus neptunius]TWT57880.1 hypothetical protein KOR42_12470 [Thalassoglobus neptunius]